METRIPLKPAQLAPLRRAGADMIGKPFPARGHRTSWLGIRVALFAIALTGSSVRAQTPDVPHSSAPSPAATAIFDPNLMQAGCSSCGGGGGIGGGNSPLGCM